MKLNIVPAALSQSITALGHNLIREELLHASIVVRNCVLLLCFLSWPSSRSTRCTPFSCSNTIMSPLRPKLADRLPSKVSFSDSNKSASDKRGSDRPSSASNSASLSPSSQSDPQQRRVLEDHTWQRVNRQSEALWQYVPHAPEAL